MTSSFDRVRVLWPDHLGLARGKYVPAALADNGVRHCTGTWALGYDRVHDARHPGQPLEEGLPDFDAVFEHEDLRPGWEPGTRGRRALTSCEAANRSRSRLARPCARPIADWRALGLEPYVGIEFEALRLRARRRRRV